MAITGTRYYDLNVTYKKGTYSVVGSNSSVFPFPESVTAGPWTVCYLTLSNGIRLSVYTSKMTNSSSTFGNNTDLYILRQDFKTLYYYATEFATNAVVTSRVVLSGSRVCYIKCTSGGTILSPSVGENTTFKYGERLTTDGEANFLTLTAGDPLSNSGDLRTRGGYGEWNKWTWTSSLTTGNNATDKTITFSLKEGKDDFTITANFEYIDNPSDTWKPGKDNSTVVVHLLDDNLDEFSNSTASKWSSFRVGYLQQFNVSSGGKTANWFSSYPNSAYLLNVDSAEFSALPTSGYYVYKWRHQRANGDYNEVKENSVTFYSFLPGDTIHLYLTTATINPKIRYDGFDDPKPSNVNVRETVGGKEYEVGKSWSSTSAASFTKQLLPVAWEGGGYLGLSKFVIVNDDEPLQILSSSTGYTFTSSSEPYSVTSVKFKQVQVPPDGELTVNVTKDTNTEDVTLDIGVSQQGVSLGSLTTTDDVGYYTGEGSLSVVVTPSYHNDAAPSDYAVSVEILDATEEDSVETLSTYTKATVGTGINARVVNILVTKNVYLGDLSGVAINVTRGTDNGTEIKSGEGATLDHPAGSITVSFTPGQKALIPIHVSCDAGTGYTLRRILVTNSDGTKNFTTVGAKTEVDIVVPLLSDQGGSDIRVVLVVLANLVATPVFRPLNSYDQGKFVASYSHPHDDFRTGDEVTVTFSPVQISGAPMSGLAVGRVDFNNTRIAIERSGVSAIVTVQLAVSENVFKAGMYGVLNTTYTPDDLTPSPSLSVDWAANDMIVIEDTTYYRLGNTFTISATRLVTGYTGITAVSALCSISDGTTYVTDTTLPLSAHVSDPELISASFVLKNVQRVTAVYVEGVEHPSVSLAVFNYSSGEYVTAGLRPSITVVAVSNVDLSDNILSSWEPDDTIPSDGYEEAVFIVQRVETPGIKIPVVRINSTGSGRLEVWDGSAWTTRGDRKITLGNDTYARWAMGTPPEGLTNVTINAARLLDDTLVEATVKVYISSVIDSIDRTVAIPTVISVSQNNLIGLSIMVPNGYRFVEWLVDGVPMKGVGISVVAYAAGVSVTPVLTVMTTGSTVPMVMGGSLTEWNQGIWISKLFRAQWPWKPLTAVVVKNDYTHPTRLSVGLGNFLTIPNDMREESPETTQITVVSDKMRRLPPTGVQKSRFVRYAVELSGGASISSVAISSGASTLKGGH